MANEYLRLQSRYENMLPLDDITGPYDDQQDERYPTPIMDDFTNTVLNPPERTGPSKMRMLGTGLLSALQGSTGPESRVPIYNEKGKAVGSREAGFWESLGNKPFNVGQANAILDMPHDAAVDDYKVKVDAQHKGAQIEKTAESNAALAEQRRAAAAAKPVEAEAKATAAGASATRAATGQMTAEHAIFINDMPKSEQFKLLQEGKITLAEINNAAAMARVQTQQAGATERTGMQQTGATERTGMQQTGANERNAATIAGANERATLGGAAIGTIPDPNDPTKQVGVWYNPKTQQMERVQFEGQNVGALQKPGTPSSKSGKETPKEIERLQNLRSKAQEGIDIIDQYILDKNGKLKDDAKWAVGGSRNSQFQRFPGMPGYEANSAIETLRGKVLVDLIAEMKSLSPTGSVGMGNLSNEDRKALERAASMLDAGISEEAFAREIKKIRDKMALTLEPGQNIEVAQVPDRPGTKPANTLTPQQIIERARARRQQGVKP